MIRDEYTGDASPVGQAGGKGDSDYNKVMTQYKRALGKWHNWTDIWEEIYDFVMPQRESFYGEFSGERRTQNIFDETAVTGLPRFASRLQLGFFPPNGRAFTLMPGPEYPPEQITKDLLSELDNITEILHEGLRNSN